MEGQSIYAQAAALLSQLSPDDLVGDDCAEVVALREAGVQLFGRAVLHARYGEQDVVTFLREQAGHREMLRRLERLQKQINKEHEKRLKDAQKAGINQARKATLEAIEASATEACGSSDDGASLLLAHGGTGEAAPPNAEMVVAASSGIVATGDGPPRLPPRAKIRAEAAEGEEELGAAMRLPAGSFRRACGVCKRHYEEVHHFYHRLCPPCATFNHEKRLQTADLTGYVAVVTGGRVRIGYEIVLKLLRAGAYVLTTTRYPHDAAQRYTRESDFDEWRARLEIAGPLELGNVRIVEAFGAWLTSRFPRIHILINNAAQTLTRDPGWFHRMHALEEGAASAHTPTSHGLLSTGAGHLALPLPTRFDGVAAAESAAHLASNGRGGGGSGSSSSGGGGSEDVSDGGGGAQDYVDRSSALVVAAGSGGSIQVSPGELLAFPAGRLDETRQPLDLSAANSWSRRLGEVSTPELLHTLAANAVAPFILCASLRGAIAAPDASHPFGHIINVSALEGKFAVGKKGAGHPHTNMSKAALNMMTLTSATNFFQDRVLVNAVDTGWVTDMAPGGVGAVAATHATHVGPPLDAIDGAARVLDPIFSHVAQPDKWLVRGKFWKDYAVSNW